MGSRSVRTVKLWYNIGLQRKALKNAESDQTIAYAAGKQSPANKYTILFAPPDVGERGEKIEGKKAVRIQIF